MALDTAFSRAQEEQLNFLALFLDVANPTSNQGWAEAERKGLAARATADAVLALALVHHLAIAKNVPLSQVVEWLVSLAPNGVVEFVPKGDAMVQELLRLREDIFHDYAEESSRGEDRRADVDEVRLARVAVLVVDSNDAVPEADSGHSCISG